MRVFAKGDRVRLISYVGEYPLTPVPAGSTGTVAFTDDDGSVWVTLDEHNDQLNEWDNQLQVWPWDDCPVDAQIEKVMEG